MVEKQVRNQYTGGAGITQREANSLLSAYERIRSIASKRNLYVVYERKLLEAGDLLLEVLVQADRI